MCGRMCDSFCRLCLLGLLKPASFLVVVWEVKLPLSLTLKNGTLLERNGYMIIDTRIETQYTK